MTELVFILDRSGSMSGLEGDTIGGFNSMIAKQRKEAGEALVSTVLFDNGSVVIHDRLPLEKVPPMTEKGYFTRGCTVLPDAVGGAIHHIGNVHKYACREDVPERTLFIITTDGYENASRRYDYETVRRMIQHEKEKYGWEFLFLGANIDAAKEAARFGIAPDRAVDYKCDQAGTALNYEVIGEAVRCVRAAQPLSAAWKQRIDADVKSADGDHRKRRRSGRRQAESTRTEPQKAASQRREHRGRCSRLSFLGMIQPEVQPRRLPSRSSSYSLS